MYEADFLGFFFLQNQVFFITAKFKQIYILKFFVYYASIGTGFFGNLPLNYETDLTLKTRTN